MAEQKYDFSYAQKTHIADAFSQVLDNMTFNDNGISQQNITTNFTFTQIQMSMSFGQDKIPKESNDEINFVPTYTFENALECSGGI